MQDRGLHGGSIVFSIAYYALSQLARRPCEAHAPRLQGDPLMRGTGEKVPRDRAGGGQLVRLAQRPILRSVVERMLQPNPASRPSAAELVQQVALFD